MISTNLDFDRDGDTASIKQSMQAAKANKVYVNTKHSSDGRSLEGFWVPYSPNDSMALFLLTFCLAQSEGVDYYSVYDKDGNRIKDFNKEQFPKRI